LAKARLCGGIHVKNTAEKFGISRYEEQLLQEFMSGSDYW
jgi:hypothetical protein